MLHSMKNLEDFTIRASDGTIGQVKDFYFDDQSWVIRYLVIDTGSWLFSRKVLISPLAIGQPNLSDKELPVSITQAQVKNSPDIDTEKPVSRQSEKAYLAYYNYPWYWGGAEIWGNGADPGMLLAGDFGSPSLGANQATARTDARAEAARQQDDDIHLRSCKEVVGYHIQASDGDIGHVRGMLVDDQTWAVRYLIVDTSNWWLGHQVLIAPPWIREISWPERKVMVNLTQQAVKDASPWDIMVPLAREQEVAIHQHYGVPGYWDSEAKQNNILETL